MGSRGQNDVAAAVAQAAGLAVFEVQGGMVDKPFQQQIAGSIDAEGDSAGLFLVENTDASCMPERGLLGWQALLDRKLGVGGNDGCRMNFFQKRVAQ